MLVLLVTDQLRHFVVKHFL